MENCLTWLFRDRVDLSMSALTLEMDSRTSSKLESVARQTSRRLHSLVDFGLVGVQVLPAFEEGRPRIVSISTAFGWPHILYPGGTRQHKTRLKSSGQPQHWSLLSPPFTTDALRFPIKSPNPRNSDHGFFCLFWFYFLVRTMVRTGFKKGRGISNSFDSREEEDTKHCKQEEE